MDMRELKALEIAARSRIVFADGAWTVPSQSGNGAYRVTLKPEVTCTCEDFNLNQKPCKHAIAVRLVRKRDGRRGRRRSTQPPFLQAARPTSKIGRNGDDEARATEKHRVQILLHDLCRGVREPERDPTIGG